MELGSIELKEEVPATSVTSYCNSLVSVIVIIVTRYEMLPLFSIPCCDDPSVKLGRPGMNKLLGNVFHLAKNRV